jgi:hypothetical protein
MDWVTVSAGSIWLGSDDGRLSPNPVKHGPRHEVRIGYSFEITKNVYPTDEITRLLTSADTVASNSVQIISGSEDLTSGSPTDVSFNVRPASEAEWELALAQEQIGAAVGSLEILLDERSRSGFWGMPCDGRARESGAVNSVSIAREWKGTGAEPRFFSSMSLQQAANKMVRLVRKVPRLVSEDVQGPPCLPPQPSRGRFVIREVAIALLIGIIPSFAWAWFNASSGYITAGWLNLTVGGVFIWAMAAMVWRPRTTSYKVSEDGSQMEPVRRS